MLLVGFETGEIKDDRPNFVVSDGRRRQWRHHVATGAGDIEKFRGIVFKRQEWWAVGAKGVRRMTHGTDTHEGVLARSDIRGPRRRRYRREGSSGGNKHACRCVLCKGSNEELHFGTVGIVKNAVKGPSKSAFSNKEMTLGTAQGPRAWHAAVLDFPEGRQYVV